MKAESGISSGGPKGGRALAATIIIIVMYLLMSFIGLSFNPISWATWMRVVFVVVAVLILLSYDDF